MTDCVCVRVRYRRAMGLEMMNTHVHMMAAGSWFGTMHAVNLTPTPAGKKVCTVLPVTFLGSVLEQCYFAHALVEVSDLLKLRVH